MVEDGATGSNQVAGQNRRGSGQSMTPPLQKSLSQSSAHARRPNPVESPTHMALQSPESPTHPRLPNVARESRYNPSSDSGHRKPPSYY
jgi:hypothetical protein